MSSISRRRPIACGGGNRLARTGREGAALGVIPGWEESAMPQDTTNLIDMLLLMFAAMIAGLFIAGTLRAWQSWSEHRRIEKHLGRR